MTNHNFCVILLLHALYHSKITLSTLILKKKIKKKLLTD
nr:MAG TPA: hypothetical protein [Caudoviricetes sp.]